MTQFENFGLKLLVDHSPSSLRMLLPLEVSDMKQHSTPLLRFAAGGIEVGKRKNGATPANKKKTGQRS